MAAVAFDTYRIVKQLKAAGFDEKQAEAVTTAIQESVSVDLSHLVTIEHFDQRMSEVFGHLKEADGRLDSSVARLETRIAESKTDTLKAVMGMIVSAVAVNAIALIGGFIAFAKMLGH